jgi:hypothetical protein
MHTFYAYSHELALPNLTLRFLQSDRTATNGLVVFNLAQQKELVFQPGKLPRQISPDGYNTTLVLASQRRTMVQPFRQDKEIKRLLN